MGQLKRPPALPSAVSTTYSGTTASSSPYGREMDVEPDRGHSYRAASTLTTGLSGGGVIHACLYLGGSPEDKLQLRLQLLLGPWPDSSMCPVGDVFVIISSWQLGLRLGIVALVIFSTTSGVGSSACLGCCHSYTHTYIQQTCPCRAWDLRRGPGAATSATSAPGIGGPSCSLQLCPNGGYAGNPGTVRGPRRGCCVRPDRDVTRPLAVDSVRGGEWSLSPMD